MIRGKHIFVGWAMFLFFLSAFAPMSTDVTTISSKGQYIPSQLWDSYEGTIPMSLVTIVGDVGNDICKASFLSESEKIEDWSRAIL